MGSKKNAMWRVVVADQRSPRDGRFIEMIGHYNPQTQPSQIVIDRERLDHWLGLGAEPTNTVKKLMRAPNTEFAATTTARPEPAEAPAVEEAAAEAEAPAADAEAEAASDPEAEAASDPEAEAAEDTDAKAVAEPDADADAEPAGEAAGDDEASGS